MPGLVLGIDDLFLGAPKTWMAGSSPATTRSARALDRDEAVAASRAGIGATGGHSAGDVVAGDFAEGFCLLEGARLAIGCCDACSAPLAIGEAAVDAVTVGVVRDNEDAVLGRGGQRGGHRPNEHQTEAPQKPHRPSPGWEKTARAPPTRTR